MSARPRLCLAVISVVVLLAPAVAVSGRSGRPRDGRKVAPVTEVPRRSGQPPERRRRQTLITEASAGCQHAQGPITTSGPAGS